MKLGFGLLAALILALMGGQVAVLTLWRCNPDVAGGDLGCFIGRGFSLLGQGLSSTATALFLGVAACIVTRRSRRWVWFGSFLILTVLVVVAVALFFLNANAPSFGFTTQDDSLLLSAVFLLPPALALLTLVYLRVATATEQSQTAPDTR